MELDTKLNKFILFIFHKFGLWQKSKSLPLIILYELYSYALHFSFSLMFFVFMGINFFTIETIINATDALFPTLTVVAYCFKLVNFKVNAYGMQKILEDAMKFQFKDNNEIQMTNEKLRPLYKVVVCFLTVAHLSMILTFFRALFANDPPELPLPSWYPIDWQHVNCYYWIAYGYQVFGAFLILNVNLSMDVFLVFMMSITSKHLEILGNRLNKIVLETSASSNVSDLLGKAKMYSELIDCIKVHQNLIRTIKDIEKCFSFGTFFQISLSGVVVCSAVYQLSMLSPVNDSVRYIYCVAFFISAVLQIFLITYFAENMLTASNSLTNQAYSTIWYEASEGFRKSLLILMVQLHRENKIIAGKIFTINLDLFTIIMKFSYQLFAVLK